VSAEHKPHQELHERIYAGLMKGDDGDSDAFIALTSLIEQNQVLVGRIAAGEIAMARVESLEEQLEAARRALDDIATGEWGAKAQAHDYDVRQFARDALSNPASRSNDA